MAGPSWDSLSRYFPIGGPIEIGSDEEGFLGSWYLGTLLRPPTKRSTKVLVQYSTLTDGGRPLRERLEPGLLRPAPPPERRPASFAKKEEVDAYTRGGWWEGFVTEVRGDDVYKVIFRWTWEEEVFGAAKLRLHRRWRDGEWSPPLPPPASADEDTPLPKKVKLMEYNFSPEEHVEVRSDEEGFVGSWYAATDASSRLPPGGNLEQFVADCEEPRDSVALDDDEKFEAQLEIGNRASTDFVDNSCTVPSEQQSLLCVENDVGEIRLDENSEKQANCDAQFSSPVESQSMEIIMGDMLDNNSEETSEKQPESDAQTFSPIEPQSMGTVVGDMPGENREEISAKQPECDAQSSAIEQQSMENTVCVMHDKNSGEQPESATQASSHALVDECPTSPIKQHSLPFVKNTKLWETIENFEVFQSIPQNPHFQPLQHLNESLREGLAIGYMVTFASLVPKAARLQLDDSESSIDDITETCADLERHGFDVTVIKHSITRLIGARDEKEKLVNEVNDLENQILDHSYARSRIDEEIQEINEQLKKLLEKHSLYESSKQKEEEEIASLEARVQAAEERIKNLCRGFEGTASFVL